MYTLVGTWKYWSWLSRVVNYDYVSFPSKLLFPLKLLMLLFRKSSCYSHAWFSLFLPHIPSMLYITIINTFDTMICKMKHIRNLPASMRVPVAPHPHQHLLLIVSHTTGCVVGSQGALISLSLMTNQVEHPSRHLLAIQIYIFSGEMSIKTFCPF